MENEPRHRKSIRLTDWDYAHPGAYFVTLCTHRRKCLFGDITDGVMNLNDAGRIVEEEWRRSSEIRQELTLDAYCVMPNHFHAIVLICECDGRGERPCAPIPGNRHAMDKRSLSALVAGFKAAVTTKINALALTPGYPVWQRNFFERIIRNERELTALREYIDRNPGAWEKDPENNRGEQPFAPTSV